MRYVDQAGTVLVVGDRMITSSYTSYGIQCIDSEYGRRIRNLNRPVLRVIKITRAKHNNSTFDYWDDYEEIPLDKDFYCFDRAAFIYEGEELNPFIDLPITKDVQRLIDRGLEYQKQEFEGIIFSYTNPTYLASHRGEDPLALEHEIINNEHLHLSIKENLLSNLKNYINERNQENI